MARGLDLPRLRLWALAGGRPAVVARDGEVDELGDVLQASLGSAQRRQRGVHHTPRALADVIASRAVPSPDVTPAAVGDPACGGGALLLAAGRRLAAAGADPADVVGRLWGADIDPLAAATTEASLALWAGRPPPPGRVVVADALVGELGWPALDAVMGNPPFLTPLATATGRSAGQREALRARFGDASLAYTDSAALFLLVAVGLVRPGGLIALVQPRSVLSTRDAAGVRAALSERGTLREVWVPDGRPFDAEVEVCVPVIEVGVPDHDPAWGVPLARALGVPAADLGEGPPLGDLVSVAAPFRTEYYGTVPHVREQADLPAGRPIATAGMVDLGAIAWGERPVRLGGRRWSRPVVEVGALEGPAARWLERTAGPKLVVAPQTKVVEVAVDEAGEFIASVPLVVVLPPPGRLWHVAAALAAPAVSAWLAAQAAGSGRSPHAVRPSPALLRSVRLPLDAASWEAGAAAFRRRELDAFADAMSAAYRSGEDVRAWWMARARTVWSPNGPAR